MSNCAAIDERIGPALAWCDEAARTRYGIDNTAMIAGRAAYPRGLATERRAITRFKKYKNQCEACGWGHGKILAQRYASSATVHHAHHIVPVVAGGGHTTDNLIFLCPNCHAIAHRLTSMCLGAYRGPQARRKLIEMLRGISRTGGADE